MKNLAIIIAIFGFCFQLGFSQTEQIRDLKMYFDKFNVDGCFVLYNQADNNYIRYNSNLCDSGYLPASTFKIPNSIIALEENIIKDTSEIIKWDGHQWPNKDFNQDQTLKSALKYSCIWVYFQFADKIGIDKYHKYMDLFNYGNKNIDGPPTYFWLQGSIRISANQQIDFLKRFYNYDLPVSKRSIDIVKNIIVLEQTDNYKLYGKTGGGVIKDNTYIMWLVGYIIAENKPYFYALNFKTDDYDKTKQTRMDLTKDILRELKMIK